MFSMDISMWKCVMSKKSYYTFSTHTLVTICGESVVNVPHSLFLLLIYQVFYNSSYVLSSFLSLSWLCTLALNIATTYPKTRSWTLSPTGDTNCGTSECLLWMNTVIIYITDPRILPLIVLWIIASYFFAACMSAFVFTWRRADGRFGGNKEGMRSL